MRGEIYTCNSIRHQVHKSGFDVGIRVTLYNLNQEAVPSLPKGCVDIFTLSSSCHHPRTTSSTSTSSWYHYSTHVLHLSSYRTSDCNYAGLPTQQMDMEILKDFYKQQYIYQKRIRELGHNPWRGQFSTTAMPEVAPIVGLNTSWQDL